MAAFDPDFAVFVKFLFPDRDDLLDRVDRKTACVECRAAVGRGDHDNGAAFPDFHVSQPAHDYYVPDEPFRSGFVINIMVLR
jgi:hypothetical protein